MIPARDRGEHEAATGARGRGAQDDSDLMRAIAAGDLAPLGALYDAHSDAVREFLRRATGRVDEADDLTHEAFLTLARIADRYDGRSSARPVLIGIAARLVRRQRRGLAVMRRILATVAATVPTATQRTPEDAASDEQHRIRFEHALSRLSEKKRLVFLMVEREGLSGEEVAQALGIGVATVWTRLHHARAELRAAVAKRPTP